MIIDSNDTIHRSSNFSNDAIPVGHRQSGIELLPATKKRNHVSRTLVFIQMQTYVTATDAALKMANPMARPAALLSASRLSPSTRNNIGGSVSNEENTTFPSCRIASDGVFVAFPHESTKYKRQIAVPSTTPAVK